MENNKSIFNNLNSINVNENVEKKNGLSYLSWAWAWKEVKSRYPDATYSIYKDAEGHPYIEDANLGLMCYTKVTINGETLEMWLPVMDGANNAMKTTPYSFKTKYKEVYVNAATMFDVNKTIMRCLTKNLAMFGLGLYIYAGEDLPEEVNADGSPAPRKATIAEFLANVAKCKTKEEVDVLAKENAHLKGVTYSTMTFEEWIEKRKSQLKA